MDSLNFVFIVLHLQPLPHFVTPAFPDTATLYLPLLCNFPNARVSFAQQSAVIYQILADIAAVNPGSLPLRLLNILR